MGVALDICANIDSTIHPFFTYLDAPYPIRGIIHILWSTCIHIVRYPDRMCSERVRIHFV